MAALLILPPVELPLAEVMRGSRAMAYRSPRPIAYLAPTVVGTYYRALLKDSGEQVFIDRPDSSLVVDFAAYLQAESGERFTGQINLAGVRVYTITRGQMKLDKGEPDAIDDKFLPTHLFNRLSGGAHGFYFFPYAYLFRNLGLGPINAFGHRTVVDYSSLAHRPASHIVITVFGGSAGWSIYSQYEEMFAQRLEDKLNGHGAKLSVPLKFTVINLSQNGNVVLNEMITFLLFCDQIRPDVVIARDGFNDMAYGQSTDPYLLKEHATTYQTNIEHWGQMLHGTKEVPVADLSDVAPIVNNPPAIVGAYARRVREFQAVAGSMGAVFVSALQPMVFSKRRMSAAEKKYADHYLSPPIHQSVAYKNMSFLYERYLVLQPQVKTDHFVNLHDAFNRFGEDKTLFGDIMHTLPEGDEAIADIYFDYLASRVLPGLNRPDAE